MKLVELVRTSREVADTPARSRKIASLSELLARLAPAQVAIAVPFLCGEIRQGRIGLGWAAVRGASSAPAAAEPTLSLVDVDDAFARIAGMSGRGSATARGAELVGLFARATADEQGFLARLVHGEIRQGALEGVLVEAVAKASNVPAAAVRRAAMLSGDVAAVALAALSEGLPGLDRFRLVVLKPIRPMLAQTAADVGDAMERLGALALEHKLDGARVQVHRSADYVRVFTREANDVTARVPELVEAALALPAREIVLDGEVIALRPDGRPLPFQTTMRRFGRRLDVDRMRGEMPLATFFFDCLHLEGEDLIDRSARDRVEALESAVPSAMRVVRRVPADATEARAFLADALARGHEGVMAKSLDAAYEAGNRGASWLKIKPAHTLDLVVIGVEWGSGRRTGTLSNLHLGARDDAGGFVMLGKTFKGLTDEMLAWQTKHLLGLEVAREGHVVWVKPELVVEIAFDGVQESSRYPAGMALRFARVVAHRPEKRADEADTVETVRAIFDGHRS